ncbi:MAG TPA: hypothetical protein VF763_03790 [Candidatus Limnocylindrales bacterium]
MTRALVGPARGLLVLMAALSIIVAACGSSAAGTPSPAATSSATQPAAAGTPAATAETGGGVSGAVDNLSKIQSYRFSITMRGGTLGQMLGSTGMTGTIVTSPKKAAHVTLMGMEIIEVDGKTWVKMGETWLPSDDTSSSSLADSLAPEKMFDSTMTGSAADGFKSVGDEKKNGVDTVHYVADAKVLAGYGELFGVKDATTWSAETWIAKDGGYPVSMSVKATGGSDTFEMTMDITNINDAANKVQAPA